MFDGSRGRPDRISRHGRFSFRRTLGARGTAPRLFLSSSCLGGSRRSLRGRLFRGLLARFVLAVQRPGHFFRLGGGDHRERRTAAPVGPEQPGTGERDHDADQLQRIAVPSTCRAGQSGLGAERRSDQHHGQEGQR